MKAGAGSVPGRVVAAWRLTWTLTTLVVVQALVCFVAVLPPVLIWRLLQRVTGSHPTAQWLVGSAAVVPLYVLFALLLALVSPLAVRALGWRTPPDAEMRLAEMGWPLLSWVRFGASVHLARVVAGTLFRGTPIWTAHLRLNGARLGKRVYINSLSVSDYNLLTCGDDVVVGGGVHMSGHTVEKGVVKTGRVHLGDRVTIGLDCVVEIDVEIGSDVQVGAMSFVPKHARLPGGATYVGVPAMPIGQSAAARHQHERAT